jgi:RNA polymerase sigma factor (sigma-70 family)
LPIPELYNDCDLLTRMKSGDQEAFSLLYRRYWKILYDVAFQRLKDSHQSEDIIQDIFVSLWSRRNDVVIENLPAYLHTALRFKIFKYVERDLANRSFYEPMEIILSGGTNADDDLMTKEMIRLVRLFAESLPEKRKEIFNLHLSGVLSTREIADQLHIKQKTVQNQLGRAFDGLRSLIAEIGVIILCILLQHP